MSEELEQELKDALDWDYIVRSVVEVQKGVVREIKGQGFRVYGRDGSKAVHIDIYPGTLTLRSSNDG